MLTFATLLWDANRSSKSFSRMYTEEWVEKLYRGFRRNLTVPFRFVCLTDWQRTFTERAIEQDRIKAARPSYASCIEAYRIDGPMILVGRDTMVVGNIDHLAAWCETANVKSLHCDPIRTQIARTVEALVT